MAAPQVDEVKDRAIEVADSALMCTGRGSPPIPSGTPGPPATQTAAPLVCSMLRLSTSAASHLFWHDTSRRAVANFGPPKLSNVVAPCPRFLDHCVSLTIRAPLPGRVGNASSQKCGSEKTVFSNWSSRIQQLLRGPVFEGVITKKFDGVNKANLTRKLLSCWYQSEGVFCAGEKEGICLFLGWEITGQPGPSVEARF